MYEPYIRLSIQRHTISTMNSKERDHLKNLDEEGKINIRTDVK